MSREIKFRAWDAANSRMEYDQFYVHQKTGLCHYFGDSIGVGSNPEFYDCGEEEPVLMQFTGLKDKNGREIYEGDIVESKTLFKDSIIRGKIIWDEAMGVWKVEEINPIYNEREYLHEVCKGAYETVVIGNIYQNPDLITQ